MSWIRSSRELGSIQRQLVLVENNAATKYLDINGSSTPYYQIICPVSYGS